MLTRTACLLVVAAGCREVTTSAVDVIDCFEDADCVHPAGCETADGAFCLDDVCHYPSTCDRPPASFCSEDDSTFYSFPSEGTCDPETGECDYAALGTACPECEKICAGVCDIECTDETGGCQYGGTCIPGSPPTCEFSVRPDGWPCDQTDGQTGVCADTVCVECRADIDCEVGYSCIEQSCAADCPRQAECNDGDPCTFDDTCSAQGVCTGSPVVCDNDPSSCGIVRACNGSDTCDEGIPGPSIGCDDGDDCTYDDHCDGAGACTGTPITCQDEPTTCGLRRSCDGTATCHESYPLPGTPCTDGVFCNGADACDGAGGCTSHAGDPCAAHPGDGDADCSEACHESTQTCTANDPNGSACNDGLYCNGDDTCQGGACSGHSGDPCVSHVGDRDPDCSEACHEGTQSCSASDPNGSACNDGVFCNGTDTCQSGVCSSHSGDPCAARVGDGDSDCSEACNEGTNSCTANDPNGSHCLSTLGNTCTNGTCGCSYDAGDPCPGTVPVTLGPFVGEYRFYDVWCTSGAPGCIDGRPVVTMALDVTSTQCAQPSNCTDPTAAWDVYCAAEVEASYDCWDVCRADSC